MKSPTRYVGGLVGVVNVGLSVVVDETQIGSLVALEETKAGSSSPNPKLILKP